jgi:hypothetical protein
MDGSGYPFWPEEPQDKADAHDRPPRAPKIVLIVMVTVLGGVFLSLNHHGVSRWGDCSVGEGSTACRWMKGQSRNWPPR